MINESMTIQKKIGNRWETLSTDTNSALIHENLLGDLIAKKLEECTYIKSIKRTQNYNGTITITVTYIDNVRRVYTVASH